jgi:thymidylate synthase ThyX
MHPYATEEFTDGEAEVLRRYFTNLEGPVFALVNLPEVVKGALFARYSRTNKSLRRLFLDEFVSDLDLAGDESIDATIGLERADDLYQKVFFEYGDDSVAQLGGVHLACEQSSNVLTKILEWGRIMSYLEQSTRYLGYDKRLSHGFYRYYRDHDVLNSRLGARYVGDMDRIFDTYSHLLPQMVEFATKKFPKTPDDTDFAYRQAIRAKALDAVRGLLPASALSSVGIYGSGQAFEGLLLRMRAHPLPESRYYSDLMLTELRKVIPSFLKRVDLEDRGVAWTNYLATTKSQTAHLLAELWDSTVQQEGESVELVGYDPDGESRVMEAIAFAASNRSTEEIRRRVA